jgi:hypothetical protein
MLGFACLAQAVSTWPNLRNSPAASSKVQPTLEEIQILIPERKNGRALSSGRHRYAGQFKSLKHFKIEGR